MNETVAIQMIGTQRSGSNLLRVMLKQLNISAPHPPHILERFMPLLPMYEKLSVENNLYRLIEDVCRLVETNPVSWGDIELDRKFILENCKHSDLVEIMRIIYELKCKAEGNSVWLNKSMANIHYVTDLEKYLKPYYLYLYRDGRDAALSFKKAIVGEKHIYSLAKQWKEEQELSLALFHKLGSKRVIMIQYEDLITEPKQQLLRICDFLNIQYSNNAMEYYKSNESRETAHAGKMWENVKKPVIDNNYNKYLKELSLKEIEIFERTAGDTLIKLGYKLNNSEPAINDYDYFDSKEIAVFLKENEEKKAAAKYLQSPEDINKRRRQNDFLKNLRSQFENYITMAK